MTESHRNSPVVVISGAGAGLGAAMATAFAADGYRVVVTDQHAERAEAVAGGLAGEGHWACVLDVTDSEQWAALDAAIGERYGRIDVLINNAGVATGGMVGETSLDDWQWVLDIDLMGVVRGCHQFVRRFRSQGYGHIINVASFAGLAGAPAIASYGTAKAGVVALSEMLRAELAPAGVEVSVLCPAFVPTRLTETMRAPDEGYAERVQRWMARSGVRAEDVAAVVLGAVKRPKFMLLTHRDTRWMYRLKRFFPELYFRVLMKQVRKMLPKRADAAR
ncbi:SDR family NAD(P)-dependent oxidoreductase [Wenzhouxiangella sp. XN79A]|uniref:SDR family NAD(P)-dependent oxidoreductase n=1 Tax=Wenzhouxiangella sp. XN79A TaxID=2724193 RepID=UPI00144A8341|nr:SDR family NAD(P)-dependent oxidoreductase [Wenzhouxiangella sp. XN79A]NKI34141.1 SDR family NAD(P)-dependent oxidoreductase [Wenzhouxiangella sp. XN79A]